MILIEELHNVFDLWCDKVGSPYFTSSQKDLFLQKGVLQFVNQYFKNPSSHVLEDTHVDLEDLYPLVSEVSLNTDDNGVALYSNINSNLPDGKEWMYFLNVSRGVSKSCKGSLNKSRWVRHNDFYAQKVNSFKTPEAEYPVHRYFSDHIKFNPESSAVTRFTLLMKPNVVTLDDASDSGVRGNNAIDLDLPDKVFNEIVYLALAQAGVSIREGDFYQFIEREVSKNV